MRCSACSEEVTDTYFTCTDNFLQTKYFDSEEENVFCSKECFCDYLGLKEVEIDEEDEKESEYFDDKEDRLYDEKRLEELSE